MTVGIVLFTRDLRVADNPALHEAVHRHDRVIPLFVLDDAILNGGFNRPNRAAFLADCLADLDAALQQRGAGLVVRRGRTQDVVAELGADAVHMAADVSGFARRRRRDLDAEAHDSLFVVRPGTLTATGKDHMAVFAAFYKRWLAADRRQVLPAPREITMPRIARGRLPRGQDICPGPTSPNLPRGGESEARRRLTSWLRSDAGGYADHHDDLAGDRTSRLSPYLHFGCLSPLDVVTRKGVTPEFVRQVAWRDFHAQVLAARPDSTTTDYRHRDDQWRRAPAEFEAWQQGRTGWPLVDAGMRQLADEGWMHNRARLVVGHFLVKTLYQDWRLGAAHFSDLLVDGDVANNTMNWQWVAGTGTDSRFNRIYNVTTQARRYDPDGDYVRRWVPELRGVEGAAVHEPWGLGVDYPDPIVDVVEGNRRFLHARGKDL